MPMVTVAGFAKTQPYFGTNPMALVAAILIVIYIVGIVLALTWPRQQRHPEDGQAIGCLMLVIMGLALLGGVLALGVWRDIPWLVHTVFYVVAFPAAMLATQGVFVWWKKRQQRRE